MSDDTHPQEVESQQPLTTDDSDRLVTVGFRMAALRDAINAVENPYQRRVALGYVIQRLGEQVR